MEGNIVMDRDLKRSIILDNYQSPNKKMVSGDDYIKINTRNVSCIDNLDIYLKVTNNYKVLFPPDCLQLSSLLPYRRLPAPSTQDALPSESKVTSFSMSS